MSAQFTLPSSWPLFRSLMGIGVICAALIVIAFKTTAPAIAKKNEAFLQQSILAIFPNAAKNVPYRQMKTGDFQVQQKTGDFYAVYDAQQQLLGFAIKAKGMGYQDTIQLLYGYSPQKRAVVGMKILNSRETPGLGDRTGKDPHFLQNFKQLPVALAPDKQHLLHTIISVKSGTKTKPWQIDSISGATISSRAVTSIIRSSTEHWIPALANHLEGF
jgi:electron transport complex protein RnfG